MDSIRPCLVFSFFSSQLIFRIASSSVLYIARLRRSDNVAFFPSSSLAHCNTLAISRMEFLVCLAFLPLARYHRVPACVIVSSSWHILAILSSCIVPKTSFSKVVLVCATCGLQCDLGAWKKKKEKEWVEERETVRKKATENWNGHFHSKGTPKRYICCFRHIHSTLPSKWNTMALSDSWIIFFS